MAVLTSQPDESWSHRILSWIYPAREWASEPPMNKIQPGINRANNTTATPRKPLVGRAGETK